MRAEHEADARQKAAPPPWRQESPRARLESAVAYVHWLMDQDRKSTALKTLQGKIWEKGYRSGELRSELYPDVLPAFERWRGQQRAMAIFSSGSVEAQKLLFAHTRQGDLTRFLQAYFDTTTGPKREAESYARIARQLGVPPAEILFLSDVVGELDAARQAGLETALCLRGEQPENPEPAHPQVRTFDHVFP